MGGDGGAAGLRNLVCILPGSAVVAQMPENS